MNVLFIDWDCFGKVDAVFTLDQMGYEITMFSHKDFQARLSPEYDKAFDETVKQKPYQFCFSFNFYPLVAEGCKRNNIPYLSLVYDNPYVMLYSYTIIYPTNYVFFFDRQEYIKFRNIGISTVYYMPLPVNATIIDFLAKKEYDHERYSCDVSFVGSLYNEDHNFYDRLVGINDYTRGYLEAIMEAQLKVYGYNFMEEVLTGEILQELQRVSPYTSDRFGVETLEYLYANYFLCRKITCMERIRLLTAIGEHFPDKLKLFTINRNAAIPHVQNMGPADYYSEMPYIFANSKINLNITLRSIQSGIPLRAMDIMGTGGFLLTNYQADFLEHFVPDEDFVYFTDPDDMLHKIDYYLSHDKERKEIAENGYRKVLKNHSFEKCFHDMMQVAHLCPPDNPKHNSNILETIKL